MNPALPAPDVETLAGTGGLDLLVTAVLLLDHALAIRYVNPAAENLFGISRSMMLDQTIDQVLTQDEAFAAAIAAAGAHDAVYSDYDVRVDSLVRNEPRQLICSVTPLAPPGALRYLIELRPIEQQIRAAREERMRDQTQANRELLRNLAHEIRNPLGGIRGAAQLLDSELDRPELREYTRVVMQEADRLQSLMDRMLAPHRLLQRKPVNVHEVLERVRSVILAEFPDGIRLRRDYDTSLPLLSGDREQLIQAVLNVVRNAAQAMRGRGSIELRTRIARSVTLARRRYRHAISVQVIDDGPGIAPEMRERIFYPLVSGREGGSGLGLPLAQTFISQHQGSIEFESEPGRTCFTMLLPITGPDEATAETIAGRGTGPSRSAR
jgi:two-component system nitrogen regulation sensor histidine kinase GlnL